MEYTWYIVRSTWNYLWKYSNQLLMLKMNFQILFQITYFIEITFMKGSMYAVHFINYSSRCIACNCLCKSSKETITCFHNLQMT